MSINESSMWAAVHRMESASGQMARAAEEITQAVQRFAFLLEPGYGGNGLRLIELLEQTAQQSAHVSVPRELLERVATHLEWDGDESQTVIQYANKCDALAAELSALLNGGEA